MSELTHLRKLLDESNRAHDKAIADGIEIVKGRDRRIAELEAQIAAVKGCSVVKTISEKGDFGEPLITELLRKGDVFAALQKPKP